MDKKILKEELNQMKYLFGYRAGKVISEQSTPTGDTKQETQYFTKDGFTYKFPGITDEIKLDKFTRNPKMAEISTQFNLNPAVLRNYELEKGYAVRDAGGDQLKARSVISNLPLSQFRDGIFDIMVSVAVQGVTPQDPSFETQIKKMNGWENVNYAINNEEKPIGLGEGEFFKYMKDLINKRANEIK